MAFDSARIVREKLRSLIEAGKIRKVDLYTAAGISKPQLDRYLRPEDQNPDVPGMAVMDALAQALGSKPWDLIMPEEKLSVVPSAKRQLLDLIMSLDEREARLLGPTIAGLIDNLKSLLKKDQGVQESE